MTIRASRFITAPALALAGLLLVILPLNAAPLKQADTTPPTLITAAIQVIQDGSILALTYDEDLDTNSVPVATAYSVTIGSNSAETPNSVDITGRVVALGVTTQPASGDTVTLSYTVPASNPVQDAAGNDVAALTNQSVDNAAGTSWFAYVTVGAASGGGSGEGYCAMDAGPTNCPFGSITDDDFELDSGAYTVTSVRWGDFSGSGTNDDPYSALHLTLDADLTSDDLARSILTIGSEEFLLSDGEYFDPGDEGGDETDHNYRWNTSNVPASIRVLEDGDIVPVSFTRTDANLPPAFDQGIPGQITVSEGAAANTDFGDPMTATDPDDDPITYTLIDKNSGSGHASEFEIDSSGQISTGASAMLDSETQVFYEVTVNITDGKKADGEADPTIDSSRDLTIVVANDDEDETVTIAGTLEIGQRLTATLSGGDESNINPLADITWQWARGASATGTFTDISAATSASYTLVDDDLDQYLRATATYNDAHTEDADPPEQTASGTTGKVGLANHQPTIDSGETAISISENTATSTILETYEASDDDNDSLTWSLTGDDSGSGGLTLMKNSDGDAELRFRVVPDYESPADNGGNNVYNVTVNVRDNKDNSNNSDSVIDAMRNVTITVTNANESPTISTATTAISKPEDTATSVVLETYMATDPDASTTLTWSLEGDDAGEFDLTVNTDDTGYELKFKNVPDYESPEDDDSNNAYEVTVTVTDNGIPGERSSSNQESATRDVTVTVTNVEEPGSATVSGTLSGGSMLTAVLTDPDGTISNEAYQWQRSATATGTFSNITSNGRSETYTLVAADVGQYLKVVVSYRDGHGSGKSATSEARGPVGASNSEPTFSATTATRTLPENSGLGANVVGGTITGTDSDSSDTLTYSLSGTHAGRFEVDSNGQIKTKSTGSPQTFNFEDTSNNSFSVTLNVRDSKDAAGNPDTVTDDTIAVTINLTNVNEAPTIAGPTTESIPENSTDVATYTATDPDASTTYTWSVESADDGGKFEISSSGALSFEVAPDFETPTDADMNNTYVVTVKVTDSGSPAMSDTHTVTVTVTNVNEAPTIDSGPNDGATITKDENTATAEIIATYAASDMDADSDTTWADLTWTLSGDDAGDFIITKNATTGDGEVRFRNVPDFEAPADDGGDNDYELTVEVKDSLNASGGTDNIVDASRTLTVTVEDVNEQPMVSGAAGPIFPEIEFDVADADLVIGTYTATDDDNKDSQGLQTITWGKSGLDAAHFSIDSMTGVLSFSIRPDFENPVDGGSGNTYEVVVEADDGQSESNSVGTFAVRVIVTNLDETPEITGGSATPSFAEIEWDADPATVNLEVETFTARDEEGETITWSLSGDDAGDLAIDPSTGVLSFRNEPDFEDPKGTPATPGDDPDNTYEIVVKATDGTTSPNTTANVQEYPVTVTVANENETPEVTGPADNPNFPETPYDSLTTPNVATFTARDEEDQDITWSLSGDDEGDFTITKDSAGAGVVTFDNPPNFEMPADDDGDNTYEFTVQASDGTNTGTWTYAVTVTDINEQPELTGTITRTVSYDENDTIDVASYTARDEEGATTWSLTGADSGDFAIDTGGTVRFANTPDYESPTGSQSDGTDIDGNVYAFTVVATDIESGSSRLTATVDVTVTVNDLEEPGTLMVSNLQPSVSPLNQQNLVTFTLSDPDGGIKLDTFTDIDWDIQLSDDVDGPWQTIPHNNPTSVNVTYIADEDHEGKHVRAMVEYIDRRGDGKTATSEPTDAVSRDPIANARPRFRAGGSFTVPEGAAGRILGQLTASDRENDTLTFGIDESENSAFFEINPSTGQVRLAQPLDFEALPSQGGVRVLLAGATLHDGKDSDGNVETDPEIDVVTTLSVFVEDVEEEGVVTLSAAEPDVGVLLTATLTDGDGGVSGQTWQWARSVNGRTDWTNISGATSSSYTPDDDDGDYYLRASVSYTDRRGAGKSAEGITDGPVPTTNRRPLFPSTETGQRTVPENTRANVNVGAAVAAVDPERNRLTYSLSGPDAAAFSIVTSTGQIRTSEALDFETKPTYSVTVEVHDGRDGSGNTSTTIDDTQAVTITVENLEEQGVVTLTTDTGQVQARVPVTATLEDDDGPTGVTWQWSRSPNGRTLWVNIAGATSATYTPTLETDAGNYIRATASYTDGHGPNKTAEKVSPRVGDPPPVNSAPAFPSTENGRREAPEDVAPGDPIGDFVAATDLNAGVSAVNDPLAYSLTGTDAASFTIDAGSGQIRLAPGVELDYEGKRTHRFTVQVTDGRNQHGDDDMDAIDDTQTVTVAVTNVNEAPVVTGDETPSFQEDSRAAVATYTGTDPERDTLIWSVSGNDFWISSRGQLYFRTPPSFESRTSYSVTVTATDDDETTPLSGSLAVTVTVTDAEEEGVVTITPSRGWVDQQTQFSASVTDPDGGVTGTTWQWARSSSSRSGWNDIPNATSSSYTVTADDANLYLQATASYEDRRGSNKTASAALASPVGDARPAANTPPEFTEDDDDTDTGRTTTRRVSSGTAPGRNVGSPVRATDADQGDVLTYSLSGTGAGAFDIDAATGQIRTKDVLDSNVQDSYSVTVSVHDGFDGAYGPSTASDDTIDVTITVTASTIVVRQPPTSSGGSSGGGGGGGGGGTFTAVVPPPVFDEGFQTSRSVSENAEPGTQIGEPISASDNRGEAVTYSLSGTDAALFTIDEQTGQISVAEGAVFDFEGEKKTYAVSVVAKNASGATATIRIVIAITNVALQGIANDYDANGNELIDLDEATAAVNDYHAGTLTREQATAIVNLYYASLGSTS